jgi:hypothetical protein
VQKWLPTLTLLNLQRDKTFLRAFLCNKCYLLPQQFFMDMKHGKVDLGRKYFTKGNDANSVEKVIASLVPTNYLTVNNIIIQALPFECTSMCRPVPT